VGIARDLLAQAYHLAEYEGENPTQASLRRAVSTAYYALFHLLVEDAALRWDGSAEARGGVERAFQHGSMKSTSLRFSAPVWQDWLGVGQSVPPELRRVAAAFAELQEGARLVRRCIRQGQSGSGEHGGAPVASQG
jgi:hypothetical protein